MNYAINTPRVTSETLDDESIVIDFETGTYYSLLDTANQLWRLIGAHYTLDEMIRWMGASYQGEPLTIADAVHSFVGELLQAELIVAQPTATATALAPLVVKQPFVPPLLECHTEIQDLLLLDPIHDVSQQGWPIRNL